jgi:hypothetical protein
MKKHLIYYLLFFFSSGVFIYCYSGDKSKTIKTENNIIKQQNKKPGASNHDTLIVTQNAAVFFQPDSLQLIKIQKANPPAVFKSMAHELFYQMRNSRNVLKANYPNIKIIETNNSRFILFKLQKGDKTIIDLDHFNDMSGIILFKTTDHPVLIDMMNIDTELGFYFNKK